MTENNSVPERDLIALAVGTRPGIVMFSPLIHALRRREQPYIVIHSGQHYSPNMDAHFFEDLDLPEPDYKIEETSTHQGHGAKTAAMLEGFERVLLERRPAMMLVGGDANTHLAAALAARKLHIPVGHVEAGERSYDWRMPEEHNRRIIDHISDLLFTTGEKGREQAGREAVQGKVLVTGNTIVDASLQNFELAKRKSTALEDLGLKPKEYLLLTTHREENVDYPDRLRGELQGVSDASQAIGLPVLFLIHPRTEKRLDEFGMMEWAKGLTGLSIQPAAGYLDFLNLLANARMAFTDSGGVQQEACIHQVPAVTLRENTEWVETLEDGANRLVGTDAVRIAAAAREAMAVGGRWPVPFGDGKAAEHILDAVEEFLAGRG